MELQSTGAVPVDASNPAGDGELEPVLSLELGVCTQMNVCACVFQYKCMIYEIGADMLVWAFWQHPLKANFSFKHLA